MADRLRLGLGQFKVSPDGKRIAVEFLVTKSSRYQNEKYSISVQHVGLEASKHAVSFDTWMDSIPREMEGVPSPGKALYGKCESNKPCDR